MSSANPPGAPVPGPPPAAAPGGTDPLAAARQRLDGVEALGPADQVEAFDAVHRLLQQSLSAIEQEQRSDARRP